MASTTANLVNSTFSALLLALALYLVAGSVPPTEVSSSTDERVVSRAEAVDADSRGEEAGGRLFYVAPATATASATRPTAASYGGGSSAYSYDDPHYIYDPKMEPCSPCEPCDCTHGPSVKDCKAFNISNCTIPNCEDSIGMCDELNCTRLECDAGTGDVTCVLPPHFDRNFMLKPASKNSERMCSNKKNVCCAHGTKCNFGPIIDKETDSDPNVPNGLANQCCVETDDGEGSSTKAIGFIAAKIPESNGTVGVDVTAPGAGLEQLKNLACYCCEGTLAIQHVANNTNITVDELKTATCQKKGFTGCNNATDGGSIKVRAADDPETFDVCALCPFTAEEHCKNLTEPCTFNVDCCNDLVCDNISANTCIECGMQVNETCTMNTDTGEDTCCSDMGLVCTGGTCMMRTR